MEKGANSVVKFKKAFTIMKWVGLTALVGSVVFGGCQYLNKKVGLSDDNMIEEQLENMILQQTGLDLDLSPGNPDPR